MLFSIKVLVLSVILLRVASVGAAGLMKSVRLCTCRIMPGGKVFVAIALSMMCLWCVACVSLKYCLLCCLVCSEGGPESGCVRGGGGLLGICVGVSGVCVGDASGG